MRGSPLLSVVTAWNLPPYLADQLTLEENCFNTWGLLGIHLLTMHQQLVWLLLRVSLLTVPTPLYRRGSATFTYWLLETCKNKLG